MNSTRSSVCTSYCLCNQELYCWLYSKERLQKRRQHRGNYGARRKSRSPLLSLKLAVPKLEKKMPVGENCLANDTRKVWESCRLLCNYLALLATDLMDPEWIHSSSFWGYIYAPGHIIQHITFNGRCGISTMFWRRADWSRILIMTTYTCYIGFFCSRDYRGDNASDSTIFWHQCCCVLFNDCVSQFRHHLRCCCKRPCRGRQCTRCTSYSNCSCIVSCLGPTRLGLYHKALP